MNPAVTRRLIAAVAVSLGLAGGIVYWQGNQGGGGILLRSGFILGAIWLAWPALVTLNPRWFLPGLAILALAVTRPGLLIWIAPVLVAVALLRRRGTK